MTGGAGSEWIDRLALEPHPEGGWFKRIHTDERVVETAFGPRAAVTSIHYLLTREQPLGRLHRNRSGILHFLQDGGPVEYVLLDDAGLRRVVLGREAGQSLFLFVPGGVWKASRLIGETSHALVSEVVTPGFDYADHEFGGRRDLLERYPALADELLPFLRID